MAGPLATRGSGDGSGATQHEIPQVLDSPPRVSEDLRDTLSRVARLREEFQKHDLADLEDAELRVRAALHPGHPQSPPHGSPADVDGGSGFEHVRSLAKGIRGITCQPAAPIAHAVCFSGPGDDQTMMWS